MGVKFADWVNVAEYTNDQTGGALRHRQVARRFAALKVQIC